MFQFVLPLLSMLGKAGAQGGAFLPALLKKYPGAAGLLGGIAGSLVGAGGQPQTIDPEKLKMLFGAQALGPEITSTFNTLINQPHVRQALTQAAQAGQQFSNDLQSRSASAQGDSSSGVGNFTEAAANQAPGAFQRGVTSQVAQQATDIAQQNLRDRMAAYVGSSQLTQQMPSFASMLGGNIANAAAQFASTPQAPTGNATGAAPAPEGAKAVTPAPLIAASPTQSVTTPRSALGLYKLNGPTGAALSGRRRGPSAYMF